MPSSPLGIRGLELLDIVCLDASLPPMPGEIGRREKQEWHRSVLFALLLKMCDECHHEVRGGNLVICFFSQPDPPLEEAE